MTATEVAEADRIFAVWERELASSGGPYLLGGLSLADLAFVPVVRRLVSHSPDLASWPLAREWAQRLMSRPSVVEWMEQAELLPPVVIDH